MVAVVVAIGCGLDLTVDNPDASVSGLPDTSVPRDGEGRDVSPPPRDGAVDAEPDVDAAFSCDGGPPFGPWSAKDCTYTFDSTIELVSPLANGKIEIDTGRSGGPPSIRIDAVAFPVDSRLFVADMSRGVMVLSVGKLRVEVGQTLTVKGDLPLVVVAGDTLVIDGAVLANASGALRGPGGVVAPGPGVGAAGPMVADKSGGGGGGNGTVGAAGGVNGATQNDGGSMIPGLLLRGGGAGGSGGGFDAGGCGLGGGGGGGLELFARDLQISGTVSASGGGGLRSCPGGGTKGAGGGGAGGMLVVGARESFMLTGQLTANGGCGGGNQGSGSGGSIDSGEPTLPGDAAVDHEPGIGAALNAPTPTTGVRTGGGGGAAGRIYVHVPGGALPLTTGLVSPVWEPK